MLILVAMALILWRKASKRTKRLAERVQALSWQERFKLAGAISSDERLPGTARLLLSAVLLYLSLPIDLIPDFIPVLGQLDDAIAMGIGLVIMRRSLSWQILESHLLLLE